MKNFDSFGVMIDCSRNAVPNVAGLKRFFDILSQMGYNCAMLYTEDTYEVKNEPFFGYKRGRFSTEELKELDRYAASRGIELIPCVQTLAHLNAIFRWPGYSSIHDLDDILLLDDERTYALIENIFATLSETYTSRRVHIGMDEAHHVGLGKYLNLHGYGDRYELMLRHLKKVCDIARKYGLEPMMWEDMFFHLATGGRYIVDEVVDFPKELTDNMPDVTMVYWDYGTNDPKKCDNMMISSKRLSDKVWFAGGAWIWQGYTPHANWSIPCNKVAVESCIRNGVRNCFITMWGDDGADCPYTAVLHALMNAAAAAEGLSEAEMKAKFREITGEDYDAFAELDLPNYVFGEDVDIEIDNFTKTRLFDDPFLAIFSKNAEGADPSLFVDYAARLHRRAAESSSFSYLFECAAALCDVLAVKFDLPARTRALYEAGDKEGMRNLVENDYSEFLRRLDRFYHALRTQWYTVNKPYGFEVQDIRLGGLMQRTKSCAERLVAWCDGNLDRIEELEEEVLPYSRRRVMWWHDMVSANLI